MGKHVFVSFWGLTLGMLQIFMHHVYPANLQLSSCKHVFSIRMEYIVDPDQMASSEAS